MDGMPCVRCGKVVDEYEFEAANCSELPPCCFEHLQEVFEEVEADHGMWPNGWYGHWIRNDNGFWVPNNPGLIKNSEAK